MNILLVNPFQYFSINRHLPRRFPLPPVTLHYLASFIPDGHEVRILDEATDRIDFDQPAERYPLTLQ